ncbi:MULTISPECIES: vWA domain-containing protein [Psychrilyobacter]|uniref:VWA domain-containing protein n=1 Tax=Psychrilyobacter piezotolerans TaxID=2293438 RepID=A0ABX9KET7_9FUSO|nr:MULTISPECIES: vWA domain-containing protein [Psychrilyobacter]MCS5421542.1 VWA domain-containing protein [Psychrilyobacter sp. S5]NDI78665.1 VWA domain-containing protein [Psychrilyobacter piezotolerans]RDE60017.1 VWA domain-containing protein [Psychrilyobacter sp. S5]REI40244.1 VWA domain-containing protein [Psychrilyobacter piezotolerans]
MKSFQVWALFLLLSITVFSSDQYIYSQITKDNLVVTDQYIVDRFNLDGEESVFSVETGDINLENFLNSGTAYDETVFTRIENERHDYNGVPRSMVKFNLNKNTGIPKEADFNLTQTDESGDILIYKRLIDENYTIPAPTSNFREEELEKSKNTFLYDDEYRLEHLIAYKYQEVVYRLYTGAKHDGIRPIKKIETGDNLSEFLNGNINYIDFIFENNGTVQTMEKSGITGKFIDGKFELMGLEDGKSYNLDLYTLRYRNNNNTGNYVVATYESSLTFNGKNQSSIQGNTGWLEDIDISNYKNIGLNVITLTNDDLSQIKLKDISEKREIAVNTVSDIVIDAPAGLSGSSINIGGTTYKVTNNQIVVGSTTYSEYVEVSGVKYPVINTKVTIAGTVYTVADDKITIGTINYSVVSEDLIVDEKKYVYRWTGIYDSGFTQEEGKKRVVSFDIEGTDIPLNRQIGIYIEPAPVVKDERYPHQRVIFERKDGSGNLINYELKDQNYKMTDRILIPARLGYRQMKSIDYGSTLGEYLLGGNYKNINEFKFENNNWSYLVDEGVEGIMAEKVISEAAAELTDEDGESILFYTDDVGHGLNKVEEGGDKVVYNWTEGPTNTNGVILNYDKVMFRIIKVPEDGVITENVSYMVGEDEHTAELPKYYWNPYDNANPINYLDETTDGNLRLEAFLFGNPDGGTNEENYIDLVMDAGSDKEITFSNAVISYEAANKNLRLIGLSIGKYAVQLYTVKRGHDGTYKVITYENYDTFAMDIPEIASEEFDKENNIHKIDFITTGTSSGAIQVNVNFITKMEREINLTTSNLQSVGLPAFKLSEKNEGTGESEGVGDIGQISLRESNQKRFLFPLDVVFVIDNSGSMQNEIDAVKDGLSAFGQELYDRGFDVKYNLITFGPEQTSNTIRNWSTKVDQYLDVRNSWWGGTSHYMAIYKEKWFDGLTLGGVNPENRREKEKDELIDAFNNIRASSGYYRGQENSAWGLHYAIEKLRANGRYLDYSGEITDDSSSGYMPSQKMIIFLTDENMDTDNIGSLGYNSGDVLQKLYAKLNSTHNGMADNINLTGLFHVRRRGNTADSANTELTKYEEEGVPDLGYKYSWGKNKNNNYWEEWDDREIPILGIDPSDTGNVYHTDFKYYNTGNNFFMYEMGSSGEHVGDALQSAISNIGIIQRWELSYLTPFNEYDGTTRTVDFKLIDVKGKDGTPISKTIRDLDEYQDKQYAVQEEKLVVEFKDPTGTSPKLSIVDGRGVITFLAKSRYHEMNSSGETIIIEDVIKERSLNVLKTDGTLLFSRTTDDITMSLSEDGWSPLKITVVNLETILDNRAESWVGVENLPIGTDPVKEILSYIDKVKYRVDGSNNYEMWLKKSEVDGLIAHDLGDNPAVPYFNLVIAGSPARVDEEYFKGLMGDRSDAWYELKNSSSDPDLFSGISSDDFEKLDGTRYRIKLGDLDLKELLTSTDGEDIELKISKTKLEAIDGDSANFEDFGQQGWYEFNVVLTETEMQILRDAELNGNPIEYIDLEATAVTDLFTQTKILEDVAIDVIPPKIVEIRVIDTTLRAFLKSMKVLEDTQVFTNTEAENYSGYSAANESELEDLLSNVGSYVKKGDLLDITLIIEDKNLTEDDIYIGIDELGWRVPDIDPEPDGPNGEKRFKLSWPGVEVGGASGTIGIENTIEDRYGNTGDQNISILNINMTDIVPGRTMTDISDNPINAHPSDGKYYVNSDYNITLTGIGNMYRAGIAAFKYDNTKSDNKDGVPTYHHSENGLYTGGIKETEFEIEIDSTHKTDGEYIGKIFGMSKSGKLIDISDYSDDDFDKILDTNYASSPLSQTTIMVDTVEPVISNVSIINRTFMDVYGVNSVNSSGTTYVKDGDKVEISYDIKDFNMHDKEIVSGIKGGYLLDLKGYSVDNLSSEIASPAETGLADTYTVTYTFTINDSGTTETDIDFNIKGEDKAGNQREQEEIIVLNNNKPKAVILKVYEGVKDWDNTTTQRTGDSGLSSGGYEFTKGGAGSLISDPMIYAEISGTGADVRYLKIDKNGTIDPLLDILGETSEIKIDGSNGTKFGTDTTNIAVITPISVSGVPGDEMEFKFIVDTRINTSYLEGGIIGSLTGGHINIDLSDLEELVGIDGYNYDFVVGGKVVQQGGEDDLNGNSFTTVQGGSITSNNIDIDTSLFTEGSRGDLIITVWDRLGHEKIFEKAYFIPTESLGVKATIEDELKQRESKLKIIGEGTSDKFELESSVDKSSE